MRAQVDKLELDLEVAHEERTELQRELERVEGELESARTDVAALKVGSRSSSEFSFVYA